MLACGYILGRWRCGWGSAAAELRGAGAALPHRLASVSMGLGASQLLQENQLTGLMGVASTLGDDAIWKDGRRFQVQRF